MENTVTVKDLFQICKCEISNDEKIKIKVNGKLASVYSEIKNGDLIELSKENENHAEKIKVFVNEKEIFLQDRPNLILSDIFSIYDFSTTPPPDKKRLIMQINGKDATFISPLKNGDKINLIWK